MDTLKSKLESIEYIASEKLKQPDAVKHLSKHVNGLINKKFRIATVYAPGVGTRQFAATVADLLKAHDVDSSQYSLFQAADLIGRRHPDFIGTDSIVVILDQGISLNAKEQERIGILRRVFGDGAIRYIYTNRQGSAESHAEELATFIYSKKYEEKHTDAIETHVDEVLHRVKLQTQRWRFLIAEAKDDALRKKFEDEFVPALKQFVKFRMNEIFPSGEVNRIVRDKINALTDQDLKMKSLSEIHTDIEEACVLTFEDEVNAASTECGEMFSKFLSDNLPDQNIVMPANGSPPGIPAAGVTKPDLRFDAVDALIGGIWTGVYPTSFALISALTQPASYALGIPVLVSAAFAVQGYRNAKSQHQKTGIDTIKNELNQDSIIAGNRVKYEFEKMIQQMIADALQAFEDAKRDKEKTLIHAPDSAFLESAEYTQALRELESECNELKKVISEYGNT